MAKCSAFPVISVKFAYEKKKCSKRLKIIIIKAQELPWNNITIASLTLNMRLKTNKINNTNVRFLNCLYSNGVGGYVTNYYYYLYIFLMIAISDFRLWSTQNGLARCWDHSCGYSVESLAGSCPILWGFRRNISLNISLNISFNISLNISLNWGSPGIIYKL